MQVRVLGPVDVAHGGEYRIVRGPRRKGLLALLALSPGQMVSTDRLIAAIWGDESPTTGPNTLHSHISHLRRLLGDPALIQTRPPGYLYDGGPDGTDLQVAERLIGQAGRAEPVEAAGLLRSALALWRGPSLVDVTSVPPLAERAGQLDRLRLQTTLSLAGIRLTLGEHAAIVPELTELAREHPFDEQVHWHLMLALYRCGQLCDAQAVYLRLRLRLDEALGIEPGQPLRELEQAISRQDPVLQPAGARMPAVLAAAVRVAPGQLPPAVRGFAGRDGELAALDALLDPHAVPTAVVITAVSGTAGVGKTALAVHWAHRAADRFPDGQLYVNLRGFDPGRPPLAPMEALRAFLEALGVPGSRVPATVDEAAALYRTVLASRRVLVVLDNARDADQVRPLLPGSAGCLAVVTSRNQLVPLAVAEGARMLTVDVLADAEATALLAKRLGAARVAAEPAAVAEIVARCAGLPLALAVVAGRAAQQPGLGFAQLAVELRESAGRLDAFDAGDAPTNLRAVLSWSYRALSPGAARLFPLLGLHPGAGVSAAAAASLVGLAEPGAAPLLAELTRVHLLAAVAPGRYALHDLLRSYAAELAARLPEPDRDAARHRMLDHYVHTADAASRLLHQHRIHVPPRPQPPLPGVTVPALADAAAARAWLGAERPALVAAIELAGGCRLDGHAWHLSRCLFGYLDAVGRWADIATSGQVALTAARRMGDSAAEAMTRSRLGTAFLRLGRTDDSRAALQASLDLFVEARDQVGQASIQYTIAMLRAVEERDEDALWHSERSYELYRAAGHEVGTGMALNSVGWNLAKLGRYAEALDHCNRALQLQRRIGDQNSQGETWDSLGYIHHHLGQYDQAIHCYRRAVALTREHVEGPLVAGTLSQLGDAHHDAGDAAAAAAAWRQGLAVLERHAPPPAVIRAIGHPEVDKLRAKLRAVEGRAVEGRSVTLRR